MRSSVNKRRDTHKAGLKRPPEIRKKIQAVGQSNVSDRAKEAQGLKTAHR